MVLAVSLFSSTSHSWIVRAGRLVNRSVVYGVITIGIIIVYIITSWVLGLFLLQMFGIQSDTVTILAAVIATAGLFSLREYVQRHIDRLFFKTRYMYSELLKETSERFSTIMELPRLFGSLLKILGASMKLTSSSAWLVKAPRKELLNLKSWGAMEDSDKEISYNRIKKLKKTASGGTVLLKSEMELIFSKEDPDNVIPLFEELGAQCIVLLFFQGEPI